MAFNFLPYRADFVAKVGWAVDAVVGWLGGGCSRAVGGWRETGRRTSPAHFSLHLPSSSPNAHPSTPAHTPDAAVQLGPGSPEEIQVQMSGFCAAFAPIIADVHRFLVGGMVEG